MKKLLTLLLALVCSVGFAAGTTTETSGKSTIQTGPASFTNFVQLGDGCVPFKILYISGVASTTAGAVVSIPTGISENKIITISVAILSDAGGGLILRPSTLTNREFVVDVVGGNVRVGTSVSNSSEVLGMPIKGLIFYLP